MAHPEHFHGVATKYIHAGQPADSVTGAVMTPISLSTTFLQKSPGHHTGFEYSRSGNPTRNAFEACVAAAEGAKHGFGAWIRFFPLSVIHVALSGSRDTPQRLISARLCPLFVLRCALSVPASHFRSVRLRSCCLDHFHPPVQAR